MSKSVCTGGTLSRTAYIAATVVLLGAVVTDGAVCGWVNGRIECRSSVVGGGSFQGGPPSTLPSLTPPSVIDDSSESSPVGTPSPSPVNGFINIEGCNALAPPLFRQDKHEEQHFSRFLFSELMKSCSEFLPANMLRIAFHDSATFTQFKNRNQGANGSIRFERNAPQTSDEMRTTLSIIDGVQIVLRNVGLSLSYADLIQLSGAEAVKFGGGPEYRIRLGRRDSDGPDVYDTFPGFDDISVLKDKFADMGFDAEGLVALSGAHTLGHLSPRTPSSFDNEYFQVVTENGGLALSDNELMRDSETASLVRLYAKDQNAFFKAFANHMQGVANMGAVFQ